MNWKKNEQGCKKKQAFPFPGTKEATDPTEKSKHVEPVGIIHMSVVKRSWTGPEKAHTRQEDKEVKWCLNNRTQMEKDTILHALIFNLGLFPWPVTSH